VYDGGCVGHGCVPRIVRADSLTPPGADLSMLGKSVGNVTGIVAAAVLFNVALCVAIARLPALFRFCLGDRFGRAGMHSMHAPVAVRPRKAPKPPKRPRKKRGHTRVSTSDETGSQCGESCGCCHGVETASEAGEAGEAGADLTDCVESGRVVHDEVDGLCAHDEPLSPSAGKDPLLEPSPSALDSGGHAEEAPRADADKEKVAAVTAAFTEALATADPAHVERAARGARETVQKRACGGTLAVHSTREQVLARSV